MASPYTAYGPREPSSNVHYANINANPTSYPYPPHRGRFEASANSLDSDSSGEPERGPPKHKEYGYGDGRARAAFDARAINRTPSPTPSEAKELQKGVFDWDRMLKWRYWVRKEWTLYYIAFVISLVGAILFTVYHKQIVNWLKPAATWMHKLPFGWTIPIGVLFVISFPPLFGHEIVAILCGLVWSLGPAFGIVAAGTFLGELGNFYAFKYCCAARGEKLERTKLQYACLARVVREGGFKIALIARLSAIPGHFTTAVFSTCGMGVITFSIAAVLSLPKQFITVYLGVALEQSEDGKSSKSDTIIKDAVIGVTTLITIGAMWYIYHKMNQAKPHVIYDRRKARQAKLAHVNLPYGNGSSPAMLESSTSVTFTPSASNADIPLTKYGQPQAGIHAPQPRRAQQQPGNEYSMSPYSNNALAPGAGYAHPYAQAVPPSQRSDPFSDNARAPVPNYSQPGMQPSPSSQSQSQPQGASYQRQAPARGYGSPSPETWDRRDGAAVDVERSQAQRLASPPPPTGPSAPRTPTQRNYPARSGPPPMSDSTNPFSDPMPNPYDRASGGARGVTERFDAAYEATSMGSMSEEDGDGRSSTTHESGPPSYSSHEKML